MRERVREIWPGGLEGIAGPCERFEVAIRDPDQDPSVPDRDRGWNRARGADGRLRAAGDLEVDGIREPVADQGGFERDDRAPLREGVGHLVRNEESLCQAHPKI